MVDDATELRALRDLYAQAGGAQWNEPHRSAWAAVPATLADAAAQLPGLTVADGDVTGLALPNVNLQGPLPTCIGELRALRILQLGNNPGLAGPWPQAALAPLSQLEGLYLYHCGLNGPLGDGFAAWPTLSALNITGNALEGPIPPSLLAAPALTHLWASGNRLNGPVPGAWANRQGLSELFLDHNQLSGTLPDALGQLTALRSLDVSTNQLAGRLPTTLASCTQLQNLTLNNNQFTGPLPDAWQTLTQLYILNLTSNQLEGPLPAAWSSMRAMMYLHAANNRLSGPLPSTWSQLPKLNQLALSNNQLSGPLPASWGGIPDLHGLDLAHNQLSGPLPALPQRFYHLDVAYNRLSGGIPEGLRGDFLNLDHNLFSGRLPDSYGTTTLQDFYQLTLDYNELTGIPDFASYNQQQFGLTGNYLQFDSYEANLNVPTQYQFFDYGQRTPASADTQYAPVGTYPTLSRSFEGAHNHYYWERYIGSGWVPVLGSADAKQWTLPHPAGEADEGLYRVRVTNDWLPWMTLYSRSVYLSLLPYEPLELNEPNAVASAPLADALNLSGAPDSVNYVRTYVARTAFTDPAQLHGAAKEDVQVTTQYLDGLGRPVQTVQHQASPLGHDLVQPMAYDALGRQERQFLPYAAEAGTADAVGYRSSALPEQDAFYRAPALPGIARTGAAYAQSQFEASPLSRVTAQASPGESWAMATNRVVTTEERPNTAADSVQRWAPGYEGQREDLLPKGAYAPGTLWVQQTRDENGQYIQTFTDSEGHLVLKQVGVDGTLATAATQWLKTYYVYDDFGRLRAVLPPLAVQRLRRSPQGAWNPEGAGVERLLFRYHYDAQGRLIEKKIPDQDGYQLTVYDELDRPVLTQDVAQQATREWVATKYDALGRVAYTALVRLPNTPGITPAERRDRLQQDADAAAAQAANQQQPLWEEPSRSPVLGRARYTHRTWPDVSQVAGAQLLAVSYYDGYDFDQDGTDDVAYQAPTADQLACTPADAVPLADGRVTGQTTRSEVRVLGVADGAPGQWLTTTTFADDQARPIQVVSTTARGGQDVTSTRYDFTGKSLATYAVHQGPNHPAIAVREQSRYDHAGRLLTLTQELDRATPQVIARHSYNELGQLMQKQLGGELAGGAPVTPPLPTAGPAPLQRVDYRYNIRGWLTDVNDVAQPDPQDLWNLSLRYEAGFDKVQFNGNLAGQTWRAAADGIERAYGYRYDRLGRLLQGDFVARTGPDPAATWGAERSNYRFWAASYDANGNLLTLRRRGQVQQASRTTAAQYAETDNLRYRYQPTGAEPVSNRLQRVDDLAPAASTFGAAQPPRPDFADGATTGSTQPDYAYDAAGSLVRDANKGIARIRYNHLHLPQSLTWQNGDSLQFRYSAAGGKVAKLAYDHLKPNEPVRTDYLGAWQYEGDSLRWLSHAEGRALYHFQKDPAGQVAPRITYEYTLKDHLGNLRIAFHEGGLRKYVANFEPDPSNLEREQHEFDSLSVSPPVRIESRQFSHTGDGVARVTAGGTRPTPIGPFKQLAVAKGDKVSIQSFGIYQQPTQNPNWGFSVASFVASLLQQPASAPLSDGVSRRKVLPLLSIGLGLLPPVQQLTGGVPRAYVRLLVYDADSNLVADQSQTLPLTAAALNNYQERTLSVTVGQAGYVQAYVGNESDTEVYFDDITVEHQQGLQVQETEYDPYGLELAGLSRVATPENKYTWNGKERQDEFGLRWHDHGWRFYDPSLGRWVVTDPDAEEGDQESWGTYQFGLDNAVRYNDLDGRIVIPLVAVAVAYLVLNGMPANAPSMNQTFNQERMSQAKQEYDNQVIAALLPPIPQVKTGWAAARPGGFFDQISKKMGDTNESSKSSSPAPKLLPQSTTKSQKWQQAEAKAAKSAAGDKSSGVNFVVDKSGQAFPVPRGATGPNPVLNPGGRQTGVAFTGGEGGKNGRVATMRIMDPTTPKGNSPGYPNGYIKYENNIRPKPNGVDPYSGIPIPNMQSHYPLMVK